MAYEPTNWQNGDIVTAEKLNKLEGAMVSAGGVFLIRSHYNYDNDIATLDKTWNEIREAQVAGKLCVIMDDEVSVNIGVVQQFLVMETCEVEGNGHYYEVRYMGIGSNGVYSSKYKTTEAGGYPAEDNS